MKNNKMQITECSKQGYAHPCFFFAQSSTLGLTSYISIYPCFATYYKFLKSKVSSC